MHAVMLHLHALLRLSESASLPPVLPVQVMRHGALKAVTFGSSSTVLLLVLRTDTEFIIPLLKSF
jgi:hypothetical protein